ncbi:MAG: alpha-L-fucosidase [Eubacteriales bacterium]|nr:alpha-L-fucosidase [Eubacteriales bacterium]
MSVPVPSARVAAFEKMGFGIFVHWGLYSLLGKGEWIRHDAPIPGEEYDALSERFTAENYDPRRWARAAREAGARYMVLTTRHHDGFSLYDTRGLNDFDAPHSAAGRDLVREFVDAARAEGVVPFFYHTLVDWREKSFETDFRTYLRYLRDSVEILCRRYGPVGGFWFDGKWWKPDDDWEEDALYGVIRRWQPEAVIVNNLGTGNGGKTGHREIDSVTFEQARPVPIRREGAEKYLTAEMCQTMNEHWGYSAGDLRYKSLPELIEMLAACRRVGANYLLNIGPRGDGSLPPMQEALLAGIGEWTRGVGGCLYEAAPDGAAGEGKDFVLRKGNKRYFFIHDLTARFDVSGSPVDKRFTGVDGTLRSVRWTDEDTGPAFTQNGDAVTFRCTCYTGGKDLVVRVAEGEVE